MKFRSLFCFCIVFSRRLFDQRQDSETFRQMNLDLNNSTRAKDTALKNRFFADGTLLTNLAIATYNEQQLLKRLMAARGDFFKTDWLFIRVSGIAVCYANVSGAFTFKGKAQTLRTCSLDVYVMRKGSWYAIAAHVSVSK